MYVQRTTLSRNAQHWGYGKFVYATNRYSVELRALLALMLHPNRHAQGVSPLVLQDSTAVAVGHVVHPRTALSLVVIAKIERFRTLAHGKFNYNAVSLNSAVP